MVVKKHSLKTQKECHALEGFCKPILNIKWHVKKSFSCFTCFQTGKSLLVSLDFRVWFLTLHNRRFNSPSSTTGRFSSLARFNLCFRIEIHDIDIYDPFYKGHFAEAGGICYKVHSGEVQVFRLTFQHFSVNRPQKAFLTIKPGYHKHLKNIVKRIWQNALRRKNPVSV